MFYDTKRFNYFSIHAIKYFPPAEWINSLLNLLRLFCDFQISDVNELGSMLLSIFFFLKVFF